MARLLRLLVVVIVASGCGGGNSGPPRGQTAPGAEPTAKTTALATGAARDARMQLDSGEARRRREPWTADARPHVGVDVLASQFPSAKGAPAGVQDIGDPSARGTPVTTMRK